MIWAHIQLNIRGRSKLVDRMRFDRALGQLYGTQFFPEKSGVEVYGKVFEPERLNDRRVEMGMPRIREFDEKYLSKEALKGVGGWTK